MYVLFIKFSRQKVLTSLASLLELSRAVSKERCCSVDVRLETDRRFVSCYNGCNDGRGKGSRWGENKARRRCAVDVRRDAERCPRLVACSNGGSDERRSVALSTVGTRVSVTTGATSFIYANDFLSLVDKFTRNFAESVQPKPGIAAEPGSRG